MSGLFELLAAALRAGEPVALAEVVEGCCDLVGRRLVVRPTASPVVSGTLGDAALDRVVLRDAIGSCRRG